MRKTALLLAVGLMWGALIAGAQASSISGTVIADNGTLVSGAAIQAYGVPRPPSTDSLFAMTISDSLGRYTLENLLPGVYTLWASHPQYAPASFRQVNLAENVDLTGVDFVLTSVVPPNENLVAGTVRNSQTNAAVAEANVFLISEGRPTGAGVIFNLTHSDSAGQYEFHNIPSAHYVQMAEATGYEPFQSVDTLVVAEDSKFENLDFVMDPLAPGATAALSGKVWVAAAVVAEGVAGAEIIVSSFLTARDSLIFRTTTDSSGAFRIESFPPAVYHVSIQAVGFHPYQAIIGALRSGENERQFYLDRFSEPFGLVTGRVFHDKDGSPVRQASVEFISTNGFPRAFAYADQDGNYFAHVPPGDYVVLCQVFGQGAILYQEYYDNALSFRDATIVTIANGERIENISFGIPEFGVPNEVVIKGKVTSDNGVPLQNALVTVFSFGYPDSLRQRTLTDEFGSYVFRLSNLINPFTPLIVSAELTGYRIEYFDNQPALHLADRLYVLSDTTFENIDFSLTPVGQPGGLSIAGTVSSDSGSVLEGAFVVGSSLTTGEIVFTFTDAQGRYTLGNLEPTPYYLLFAANGHVPEFYSNVLIWEQATPVFPADTGRAINASLSPIRTGHGAGQLAGRVFDPNGTPLASVLLTIQNEAGKTIGYDFSDGSGRYELQGLAQGRYRVQATRARYASDHAEIEFAGEQANMQVVNFTLQQQIPNSVESPKESAPLPEQIELSANYPNPFNPSTTISFALPEAQDVHLVIYNLLGRQVKVLLSGPALAGHHQVQWDGTDFTGRQVASGLYFYSLQAGETRLLRKMVLSR